MIEIIPAIDLINGQCVRLTKGKFDTKRVYSNNPVQIAKEFEGFGIKRLHLVDLDGAQTGSPQNLVVLQNICEQTNLIVDYGGGIRTKEQVAEAFEYGAKYIVIGSLAVKDPVLTKEIIETFGAQKVILAADVNDEKVSINGWQTTSKTSVFDFISDYTNIGISQFICTDISRDGMLSGSNAELYVKLKKRFPKSYIIASGGVHSEDDVLKLNELNIDAIVIGKAIYEGIINLPSLNQKIC